MRPVTRPIAGLLCAAVLAASPGCSTSSVEVAEEESRHLYPGMTMQEVADRLGNPTQVLKGDPGSDTVWIYRFEGGPNAAATVVMVVVFVAVIAAAVLGGGGSVNVGSGGGPDGPPSQIRLTFDGDGRLRDISAPHPVSGP